MKLILCTLLGFAVLAVIILGLCAFGVVSYRLGACAALCLAIGTETVMIISLAYLIGKGICQ